MVNTNKWYDLFETQNDFIVKYLFEKRSPNYFLKINDFKSLLVNKSKEGDAILNDKLSLKLKMNYILKIVL